MRLNLVLSIALMGLFSSTQAIHIKQDAIQVAKREFSVLHFIRDISDRFNLRHALEKVHLVKRRPAKEEEEEEEDDDEEEDDKKKNKDTKDKKKEDKKEDKDKKDGDKAKKAGKSSSATTLNTSTLIALPVVLVLANNLCN